MPHPVPFNASSAPLMTLQTVLFEQAARAGRSRLDPAELAALLAALGALTTLERSGTAQAGSGELRVSLQHSREFGMVLSAGLGGFDGALDAGLFRRDRARVQALAELSSAEDFLMRCKGSMAYQKLLLRARRQDQAAPDAPLLALFENLLILASADPAAPFTLTKLDLEIRLSHGPIEVLEAHCEFAAPALQRRARPIAKIEQLLHPATIGLIGVSGTSMNFGRIILRNLLGSGYPKTQLTVIRPDATEIDGVACVANLQSLTHALDLLIVAVAAEAVPALVDEIIASGAVASVMLIPGGLGETSKSREAAALLGEKIDAAHALSSGGPIFLGANCLVVVSHPGGYDSWFIPLERLPKPAKKAQRNSVMLSQSGAFMITRLRQNPWLDPSYILALGNQTDLTHGDLLRYFAQRPEIETLGIYIEGFKDGDGLLFAKAVRQAVLAGKQVVVYKAGRTDAGSAAVLGHTASVAGDPALFEAVLRQAGAIVARDINAFDDLFYIAGAMHHKKIGGNRLGAISGAGFEAVAMADELSADGFSLQMGELQPNTVQAVAAILQAKKLAALVEVRNPIDINPGADDEAHLQIAEAFLLDAQIDALVLGLDPTAPSVRALQHSLLRPGYDISDPLSTVQLMPPLVQRHDKPLVGIVDGGRLFDAMCDALMDRGVCVFRNCARGTSALRQYIQARQATAALCAARPKD